MDSLDHSHLDNPDKAQYDTSDVVSFYADYLEVIGLPSDKYLVLQEIMDFIDQNDIHAYSTLVHYARHHEPRWFRVLCDSSTLLLTEYIKSRSWSMYNSRDEIDRLNKRLGIVD